MTDDSYIDLDSIQGQAVLIAQTRAAIDAIGAVGASSPDGLVQVWVSVSGTVVDIELDEATRVFDREQLARLITATAQRAAQNAAAKVSEVLADIDARRTRLLQELGEVDPDVAATLREVAAKTRPDTAPPGDPFSFYQQLYETPEADDW